MEENRLYEAYCTQLEADKKRIDGFCDINGFTAEELFNAVTAFSKGSFLSSDEDDGVNATEDTLSFIRGNTGYKTEDSLNIRAYGDGTQYRLECSYDPSEFTGYMIKSFVKMYDHIVSEFMIRKKLKDVTLVSREDERIIENLYDSEYPVAERPAYRLLQDSTVKYPDRVAVVAADRRLTYRQLNEEANALGHVLKDAGAGVEGIVAVMAERDSYAYVMRQGVLKSGAAFLPIDPEYPQDRIRFILEDSGAQILVTTKGVLKERRDLSDDLSTGGIRVIEAIDAVQNGSREDLNIEVPAEALAYVIYTSGSTGKPKGVMLTNKNLVNFVDDDEKNREIQGYTKRGHVSLAIAALTFDFSIMEEFVPLANGMTVVLATKEEIMNPGLVSALMKRNSVDVMSCTPGYLLNMLDMGTYSDAFKDAVKGLRSVDLGAEAFPPALFEKLKEVNPGIHIMNGYGPTEATISCTMQVIDSVEDITIGIPNVNVSVATTDRDGRLQPLGALGEMVIIGDGVGRGYIGRDDLTKKSFISLFGKKAYKSGDLVRIREDKNIEFHGRIDNQVKLRGLRVELGEIESVINSFPGVSSCIVIVIKQESEYLAAYFSANESIDINSLKDYISTKLTAYMVPQAFMQLESMPLTANGKIDKKALPKINAETEETVPPENDMQEAILKDAAEVIKDLRLGITTDLFAAGMSSISCIRLCALLSDRFNKSIKVAEIFENKTVKDIERLISEKEEDTGYEIRDEYPLSMTQTGIYIECEKYKGTTIYNLPQLYELDSEVDITRLSEAVEKVIRLHPYLMMQPVKDKSGELWARRRDELEFKAERVKCAALPAESELVRPFDLESDEPLLRATIFETEEGNYFFFDTHHIVSDGGSIDILIRDIDRVYRGEELKKETYTGYEFALDEEKLRKSERYVRAKAWHDSIFEGLEGETVPFHDGAQGAGHAAFKFVRGNSDADGIRRFCEDNGLTLNAFYTAAFGLALKAYTGSEQAVFSAIYNGRNDIRLTDSVSMLVKTLPVYLECAPGMPVKAFIEDCQGFLLSAMSNDIYSFAEIRNAYGIKADVLFAFQGEYEHEVSLGGKSAKARMLRLSQTRSEFGIDVFTDGQATVYEVEYDPSSYSEYTIDGIVKLLDHIASEFTQKKTLKDVTLTDREDEDRILGIYDTDIDTEYRPAYRLLQDAADKYPERTAVIAVDRTLTYRELNEEANALGHVLQDDKTGIDTIVAVLADRDSYAYVMREGVLKSGGAFLPIDPEYPDERIRIIIEDSGCRRIVTTSAVLNRRSALFEELAGEGVRVFAAEEAIEKGSRDNINAEVSKDALAYVIYTSGSTGKPKGVMLENHNLVNFANDNVKNIEALAFLDRTDTSISIAPLTFDVSVLEEFVPYLRGMTNVFATMEQFMDASTMRDLIINNGVGVMTCTPTYLLNMVEIEAFKPAVSCFKCIDVGSEAFPAVLYDKLKELNPDLYIVNTYGPTECTVSSTLKEIKNADDITIGRPLANIRMATLDRDERLQPLGAMGELVIMGEGVGRGYIGRDDLNEKNFIKLFGLAAYRSGDLARIRKDGDIDFHGRMDDQVKLRGLRVELGEIQSAMGSYPGISACAVVVAKSQTDFLAAYFTADRSIDIESLREHLSSRLTAYMVPQVFMQLESMPLTANGKIDRKKLPKPAVRQEEIVPAQNDTQRGILEEVGKVLGREVSGITTDLFGAGLSSIGCIKLCTFLSERFGRSIKVAEIFENKTVRDIERLISEKEEDTGHELLEEYPLSMTQTGIYIECEKFPGSTIYNIPSLYKLDSSIDTARLAEAVNRAVKAHPYLFMRPVKNEEGELRAVRRDELLFDTERITCPHLPKEAELVRAFDLSADTPLFRAEIYETEEGNYFFLDTHHIVSDGSSLDILIRDINRAYEGEEIPKEKYTGYDLSLDEEKARSGEGLKKAQRWYDSIFAGCQGETLPVRDGKEGTQHIAAGRMTGTADAGRVQRFCEEGSLTLNAFYTAAFGLALKAYTAGENALFCTIYNGRNDSRLADSVSMLVKTLPVYLDCLPETPVTEFIENCGSYLLSAMANDILSFAEIRNAYDIKADILFAFQGEDERIADIGGKPAELKILDLSEAKSAIGIDVFTDENRIIYEIEYDPSAYSEFTVKGLVRLLDHIVSEFTLKERLKDVTLVSREDERIIDSLYDSGYFVAERPAYRLLQDSADKYPDRTALVAGDRSLTYRQLNEEANALGHVLKDKGAGPERIVAVMAERDSYAYVMRQGVLKSGGAFLPIDPEYPEDRIRFILEDSKADLLVTTKSVLKERQDLFNALSADGICVIEVIDAVKGSAVENLDIEVPCEALAYVIYTSGSTGRPKGVMLTNKNLVNFVDDDEKNREIQGYTKRGHVSLAIAALTFDFSIMEEFVPIANGMTVVLATKEEIMNPMLLSALMKRNKADIMSCTPSYLLNMLDMSAYTDVFTEAVKNLRSVDLGAEAFPPALFNKLKEVNPDILIMNGYGPTEATISCTMQVIDNVEDITIGIPNVNVSVATIDREGRLQPLGALGEMVIIGDGVGRGYIGRDDLTKQSFITLFGKKAYRSGDLVRIREDGNIEFHGRIDNQVKLRGLRVELGEIESVINSYPGISSCIVIVVKQETEYLASYFTAKESIDISSLKDYISTKLTEYMVPQVFMQLESMPLTANGKIDKKKLPKPTASKEEIVPAKNDTQRGILEEVEKVLGREVSGITADLFSQGLSSIGCIKLCTFLSARFGKSIKVADIFERKTVKEISELIDGGDEEKVYGLRSEYPLSMTQMGIFLESIRYVGSTVYNIPYLYRLSDDVDMKRLGMALDRAFEAHPVLFMTLRNADNKAVAVRNEVHALNLQIQKVLPGADELVRPFDLLSGQELYRVGLYDTADGKYLFIDLHHIISDGESFNILLEDIDSAYRGQSIRKEEFTGFDAALFEEEERRSDRYQRAKEWYDGIFKTTEGVVLPEADKETDGERIGLYSVNAECGAKEVKDFCSKQGLSLNAFFTAVFGLSLKAYTGTQDAVFTTIYNGRSDPRTERCVSMFVKTLPVRLTPDPDKRVSDYIAECGKYLINAMANDIVSFSEISREYGIESDILFAYQGEDPKGGDAVIGTKPAEETELSLSQAKAPFGLDISIEGDAIIYEYEFDPELYGINTMKRFTSMLDAVLKLFITEDRLSAVYASETVRKLSGKHKKTVKTSGSAGDPSVRSEGGGKLSEVFCGIFKKVLGLDKVNAEDNFFEIGGTSLTAAQVMMAAMSKDLPVNYKDVFDHPTAAGLAVLVEGKNRSLYGEGTDKKEDITPDQDKADAGASYSKALSKNTIPNLENIRTESLGNVLLTGAAGFLGIHLLYELLKNGTQKIYCLMHKKGRSGRDDLMQTYFYYFGEIDKEEFERRVIVVSGDITDPDSLRSAFENDFKTVINCAGCVKHFADAGILKQVNTLGVVNLSKLCIEKKARLIHMSTVSVAGDSVGKDAESRVLSEDVFDLGQEVESNGYVHTKYLAEKYLLEAVEKEGLDAKIMRLGNLMSRYSDGEFQINFYTNNFMNTIKAYVTLSCFPADQMAEKDEFSPIDEVARAVVLLSGTGSEFTVFNVYNSHSIELGDIIYTLKDMGFKIDILNDGDFNARLESMIEDESKNTYVSPLVNYNLDDDDIRVENTTSNTFTVTALYRLGFRWSITDEDYIRNSMEMLDMLGFFDPEI